MATRSTSWLSSRHIIARSTPPRLVKPPWEPPGGSALLSALLHSVVFASFFFSDPGRHTHIALAVNGLKEPVSHHLRSGCNRCHRLAVLWIRTDSVSRILRRTTGSGKPADTYKPDGMSSRGAGIMFMMLLSLFSFPSVARLLTWTKTTESPPQESATPLGW